MGSKDLQEKTDALEQRRRAEAEQNEAFLAEQAKKQADEVAAAQQERVQAQNEAQRIWQQRMDEGYNTFADLAAGYKRQISAETDEMNREVANNQKAAQYTGFAELGSALANLIGVGGFNAAHQQHKTYSQDWMKRADQERREHRSRIDNLRERQRGIEQQLSQLKMGNAGTALSNAMKMADQAMQDRITLAQARYNAAVSPMQYRQQADAATDQLAQQGAYHAASVSQSEASLAERRRENEATLRSKGFNADGTPNETYMKQIAANSTKSSGSSSTDAIPILDRNGKVNIANLRPHELEAVLANAQSAIANDLGDKEAAKFTKEFRKKIDDKAGQNAVLMEWMGKSKTCEKMLRAIDANYRGVHGVQLPVAETPAAPAAAPVQRDTQSNKGSGPIGYDDYRKKLGL